MYLDIFVGGVNQGLLWALLAVGVYLTYRLLDFADLTVEGTFATGGAVVAIMVSHDKNPLIATMVAFLAGGLAGLVTGLLHTKLKIPPILSGILTMIALYSINIHIMNSSNQSTGDNTIFVQAQSGMHLSRLYSVLVVGVIFIVMVVAALYWYFGTESGSAIRATGANERMARAQGINTDTQKILCLMISNAIVGLSGALVAQEQSFGDVGMGIGAIVIGLASVIIGETIFGRARSFLTKLIGVVIGSVVYRVIITFVINSNFMEPSDIKLLTAIIVALALSLPTLKNLILKLHNFIKPRSIGYATWCLKCQKLGERRKEAAAQRKEKARQRKELARQAYEETHADKVARKQAAEEEKVRVSAEKTKVITAARKLAAQIKAEKRRKRRLKRSEKKLKRLRKRQLSVTDRLYAAQTKYESVRDEVTFAESVIAFYTKKRIKDLTPKLESINAAIEREGNKISVLSAPDNEERAILHISNLSKTFNPGTLNEKKALSNLSLEIKKGDFITVIGGNGAGKSTLLNMISGVYKADSGDIYLDRERISGKGEHRRAKQLGRVFQDPMMGTAASMGIEENLALAFRRGKMRTLKWAIGKAERGYYKQQLKRLGLGLESRLSAKVGLLSGGQRQALTLLMATLVEPKLLLLDEHTAALDPKTASKVLELTEEITSERKLSTLMITHNMKDAIRYGNRLIMMHEGNIIYDVAGEEKKNLTVDDLLKKFEEVAGGELANDRMLMN